MEDAASKAQSAFQRATDKTTEVPENVTATQSPPSTRAGASKKPKGKPRKPAKKAGGKRKR